MMKALVVCAVAGVSAAASADVLWNQTIDLTKNGYANTISGSPPFGLTAYTVTDVHVAGGWEVNAVSTYFTNFNFDWSGNVDTARLNVFAKSGALPAAGNNPGTGTLVSISVTELFDEVNQQGYYKVTASGLHIALGAGDFWIGLTPVAPSGPFGPEYGVGATTLWGDASPYRSPFSGFGDPPANTWTNVSGQQDAAILVEGVAAPTPGALSLLGLGGLCAARRRR